MSAPFIDIDGNTIVVRQITFVTPIQKTATGSEFFIHFAGGNPLSIYRERERESELTDLRNFMQTELIGSWKGKAHD